MPGRAAAEFTDTPETAVAAPGAGGAERRAYDPLHLSERDAALLRQIEASLPIVADVSRSDLLLCTLTPDGHVLALAHGLPCSISSLYRHHAAGRTFPAEEHPLVVRALRSGSGGRRQREVLHNGAPVIEDVYPVRGEDGRTIAAVVVETNMIAHERQKRRDRHFRAVVDDLLEMCARGEVAGAECLTRFGLYDGIYLVDRTRTVVYMSGIAANMFRTVGLSASLHGQPLSSLEKVDADLVEHAFATGLCAEERTESDNGRLWIRRALPIRAPAQSWRGRWLSVAGHPLFGGEPERRVDQVLILLHNATEAAAKQRELNVKSALIQEVHHRVKNNLQNIAAILRMQARRSDSEEVSQHLTDAVNRVLSMSVIHEFLSQSENRSINVRDVCHRIANQVRDVSRNPEQEIEIRVQGPSIRLPAAQATPVALVINELLLNALEHGLNGRSHGVVTLSLADLGDAVQLAVQDDGSGLPPDFDPATANGLGLLIVKTLVQDDLKGSLVYTSLAEDGGATGTQATVIFPKRPLHAD
jgi:two-component sensor histidine kinase